MRQVFFGDDGMIRSGWRAVTFFLSFVLIATVVVFASIIVLSQVSFGDTTASYLKLIVPFAISAMVAILFGWGYGKLFESLPFSALGLTVSYSGVRSIVIGILIGIFALVSALLIALMGGGLTLSFNNASAGSAIATTLLVPLIIFVAGALSEEALFRGYLLQTFVRSELTWFGVILTSMLFAFAHSGNPGATYLATFNTVLAGVWFALAYLKTRDLWFPLGIHIAWNWLQGPVFGINVSGIAEFSPDPLFRATDHGPASLTGGAYGIEGGFACTIALAIFIGVVYFLPIKRSGS